MEEEVVIVEEVQFQPSEPAEPAEPVDPGCMLACGERDIFDEDITYTVSELMAYLGTPTQEDTGVAAYSPEVEEALKPVPIEDWVSVSEKGSMDIRMEGQYVGQEDPSLSS